MNQQNKKFKILFIPHNGKPYGANKSLLSIMTYFNARYDVLIITPFRNYLEKDFINNNIKNINIPFFPQIIFVKFSYKYILYPALMILNLISFPFLLYRVLKFKPDLIYSNSSVENMGFLLSKILKVKHITHVREFGDLDYNFVCLFGKNFKTWYLNQNNGIIFNSKIIQETVIPKSKQITSCKTIYNGIDITNSDSFNAKTYDKEKLFNIGIVGYIHPEKGQLESLYYLKKHLLSNDNYKLSLYGDGEKGYLNILKKYIKQNFLEDKVCFKGFIKDTSEIYDSIDLLVVFAKNEAFGRVTIEAMLRGVPVIGYNGGGTPEIITQGINGLLFNDEKHFDENFERLVSDPLLYHKLSSNAISKIQLDFSEDKYVKNIEDFVLNILT